jgi:ABC-type antimicrobial peptide transport system permease subunit
LKILALSHQVSDFGVWPFSETLEAPVIITSIENFNDLYPRSKYRLRMYYHRFKVLTETQFPTAYGKTYVYIHTKDGAYSPKYQVELQRIGLTYNTPLTFLMAEKESIFQQSLKLATIIMTLGLSIALVILMILFNTSQSKVENERKRIGILQAIGITNKQFKIQYLLTGLSFGLIALIIGHLVLGFALVIMGIIAGGPLLLAIKNILWLYPIGIHVAICITYLLLSIITYYLPLGKILLNQPIYNINSNQR